MLRLIHAHGLAASARPCRISREAFATLVERSRLAAGDLVSAR